MPTGRLRAGPVPETVTRSKWGNWPGFVLPRPVVDNSKSWQQRRSDIRLARNSHQIFDKKRVYPSVWFSRLLNTTVTVIGVLQLKSTPHVAKSPV